MAQFTGRDANEAIIAWWDEHGSTLPENLSAALGPAIAGPDALTAIITALESLYAARASLPESGLPLLGDLARFVGEANFYGKGSRAVLIAAAADRIIAGGLADAEGDPVIDTTFAPGLSPAPPWEPA